jgi:drug/metabolite transporter (DMT)-like permease
MKTRLWAFGLVLLCTAFTSTAQIFYKFGAGNLRFDILSLITNYYLIIGICLYALGAVILIIALRGGELSVLYPIIATSYIWVSILSVYFLDEAMNLFKWFGVLVIFLGVSFVGIGSKKDGLKYTEAI